MNAEPQHEAHQIFAILQRCRGEARRTSRRRPYVLRGNGIEGVSIDAARQALLGLGTAGPAVIVGVSGHQDIPPAIVPFVRRGIEAILRDLGSGWTGVSCLAAGADQLFARAVIAQSRGAPRPNPMCWIRAGVLKSRRFAGIPRPDHKSDAHYAAGARAAVRRRVPSRRQNDRGNVPITRCRVGGERGSWARWHRRHRRVREGAWPHYQSCLA